MKINLFSFVLTSCAILMFLVAPEFLFFNLSIFVSGLSLLIYKYRKKIFRDKLIKNIITIVLTLAIVAMINFIGLKNSKSIDLTVSKIHTLSDKSKKIVNVLESPLKLTIFAKRENWDNFLKLMALYRNESKLVEIKAIDPLLEPAIAANFGITSENELVIEYQGKKALLKKVSELNITNRILKFVSKKKRTLCYTSGHGEFHFEDQGLNGLSFLSSELVSQDFEVKAIDLLKGDKDCSIILSLGIKTDFLKEEIEIISQLNRKGVSYLATLGPSFSKSKRDNILNFFKTKGIKINNSVIIDRLANIYKVDATINVFDTFLDHPIVVDFKERIFMPLSLNLELLDVQKGSYLFETKAFPASWAELDLENLKNGKAEFSNKDIKGPVSSAVALEKDSFRIVLFGSEQFILNAYQGQKSNFNLFFNSLDWLFNEEELISLDRPSLRNEHINLSSPTINTIFYFIIILIPFLFFMIAGFVYKRNKRL